MDTAIKGIIDTGAYIKHGIDTYNRQAKLRDLMNKGGIEAIKRAIEQGEIEGGAKKGLDNKRTKKKKTIRRPPQTIKPASSQAHFSRVVPYHTLGTVSQGYMPPQAISNPLLQRSLFSIVGQQQQDPSLTTNIQKAVSDIQEIKKAQQEIKSSPLLAQIEKPHSAISSLLTQKQIPVKPLTRKETFEILREKPETYVQLMETLNEEDLLTPDILAKKIPQRQTVLRELQQRAEYIDV